MAQLKLLLLTPTAALLDLERVDWVHLCLADQGVLTVYPRHAPLLAQTLAGQLQYRLDGEVREREIGAGLLSIRDDRVVLLFDREGNG